MSITGPQIRATTFIQIGQDDCVMAIVKYSYKPLLSQMDFSLPKMSYANRLGLNENPFWRPQPFQEQQGDLNDEWGLYPNVIRNIENFGND
ncbi:hypothetical protein G6F43_007307 [Rhizopus delemar]|nr:hypothetical protein G6F43_007307 [Rhizopus delemar]